MKFTRLKITGFKSFAETCELLIEPGLTGVVGPNGCGKSNLVEALRWVMGESSVKTLRADDMDQVIFSGTDRHAARSFAEVVMKIDNREGRAPAEFNQSEDIEILRRVDRGSGSTYRVNGKVARAGDVQLLFADASSGARSPSLVRQGQIGELIGARPRDRRRILEDAAGISGLHARRQDAERRLRRSEENLDRADDLVTELKQETASLQNQARQASRFRALSQEIKRYESAIALGRWRQAGAEIAESEAALKLAREAFQETKIAQISAAKNQALANQDLPTLRRSEAEMTAAIQRLIRERDKLDGEKRELQRQQHELERQARDADQDQARERVSINDAEEILGRLAEELAELEPHQRSTADQTLAGEELAALIEAEKTKKQALEQLLYQKAEEEATRRQTQVNAERILAEHRKFAPKLLELDRRSQALELDPEHHKMRAALEAQVGSLTVRQQDDHAKKQARREAIKAAREALERTRTGVQAQSAVIAKLETEARTLENLLDTSFEGPSPLADQLQVLSGFEEALGAALGDDLRASMAEGGDPRWQGGASFTPLPALPEGVKCLAEVVQGAPSLAARFSQIGIVEPEAGDAVQMKLKIGQRLVSREGDLWRWDGYFQSHQALSTLARLLKERNRLFELNEDRLSEEKTLGGMKEKQASQQQELAEAEKVFEQAELSETEVRQSFETAREALVQLGHAQAEYDKQSETLAAERRYLQERLSALEQEQNKARLAEPGPESGVSTLDIEALEADLLTCQQALATKRAEYETMEREHTFRQNRMGQIRLDRGKWSERLSTAKTQLEKLAKRAATSREKQQKLIGRPDELTKGMDKLQDEILKFEEKRQVIVEKLAAGENVLTEADRTAAEALTALGEMKAIVTRQEERLAGAQEKRELAVASIQEQFSATPAQLLAQVGAAEEGPLPEDASQLDERLIRLRAEREKLGGVNLLAEQEIKEKQARLDNYMKEIEEITEAIKKLRQGVTKINKEGREKLLAAFEQVNAHFQLLFRDLFPGGTAHLQLTDVDDPLEAGLEIHARPPGKKLQTLTLLSGGEQTLTALALIFAVFLTNPAPVCVLDEADAPLDDVNVERYCALLEEMVRRTSTRFLVVTHNPLTMSRVDRLFGVTMPEFGISKIVSVDLQEAVTFAEG